jgi:hypothetical protein
MGEAEEDGTPTVEATLEVEEGVSLLVAEEEVHPVAADVDLPPSLNVKPR